LEILIPKVLTAGRARNLDRSTLERLSKRAAARQDSELDGDEEDYGYGGSSAGSTSRNGGNGKNNNNELLSLQNPPFELEVVEAALMVATAKLDNMLFDATKQVQEVLQKLPLDINPINLEELRRVKALLVELESRAATVVEVLEQVLDDEDELRDFNLTSRPLREEKRRTRERLRLEREMELQASRRRESSGDDGGDTGGNGGGGGGGIGGGGSGLTMMSGPISGFRGLGSDSSAIGGGGGGGGGSSSSGTSTGLSLRRAEVRERRRKANKKKSNNNNNNTSSSSSSSSHLSNKRRRHVTRGSSLMFDKSELEIEGASDDDDEEEEEDGTGGGVNSNGVVWYGEDGEAYDDAEEEEDDIWTARGSITEGSISRSSRRTASTLTRSPSPPSDGLEGDGQDDLAYSGGVQAGSVANLWEGKSSSSNRSGGGGGNEDQESLIEEAIEELEDQEEAERELEEVEDLFEYYLQRCAMNQSEAERLLAGARDLEESIGVSLSARRLAVIRLELMLSIGSFAAALGAVISSIFGMNLRSTFENSVVGFWGLTGGIVFLCVLVCYTLWEFAKRRRIL